MVMFYLSTQQGVWQWDENSGARQCIGLEDEKIYQVVVANGYVAVVGEDGQVWERDRGVWTATQVADDVSVKSLLIISDVLYAGTEPTRVFRKPFGARRWELVGALDQLPLAEQFYTPWGGPACVRSIAAKSARQFYLDIHVGGIVRTRDSGATWEAINNGIEEDVHQVATHPLQPQRVYAATADGFYLSDDEGATWQRRNAGLTHLYCRGLAVHPQHPDIVLMSGSPFAPPGWRRHGPQFALFRSDDAGRTWRQVIGLSDSLPAVIDTHGIAFSTQQPDRALCAAGALLYASDDAGITWRQVADDLPPIRSLCFGGAA
ncbi:MAG: hypothetical protein NZT92_10030 [Abditibacteriales bacterium]|nr:hypothetical protein [Abditibacteriales bacterium]MDW8367690.1 hypothetical protein [Abditibacteriales bacterium]